MTNRPAAADQEQRLRLFVAVELPETWRAGLSDLMAEMQAALAADARTKTVRARWVRPDGIHLTLKFLGETPAGSLTAINAALARAAPATPAIRLDVGRAGSFSDRQALRVIWVGIGGETQKLAALAQRVDLELAATGYPRERRPFAAHLTLARLPDQLSPTQRELVLSAAQALPVPSIPSFNVERLSLMRSHLGPGGARYERLAAFPP